MSFVDAVVSVGQIPGPNASREAKKRYAERLAGALAQEVAKGLRAIGFKGVIPAEGGSGRGNFRAALARRGWTSVAPTTGTASCLPCR
jgi:hypothetical protein